MTELRTTVSPTDARGVDARATDARGADVRTTDVRATDARSTSERRHDPVQRTAPDRRPEPAGPSPGRVPPAPTRPGRSRLPSGSAPVDLLDQARAGLLEAGTATLAGDRYVAAHLAALRAGAAVLAARARPRPLRGPRNVWEVLPRVAPELTEWAAFFAVSALTRAAIEAGITRAASARDADDLLREAEHFVGLVAVLLGLPHQEVLAGGTLALGGG